MSNVIDFLENKTVKIIKNSLAFIALAITIYAVIDLNYKDLSWQTNHMNYITILLGISAFFNLYVLNRLISKRIKESK